MASKFDPFQSTRIHVRVIRLWLAALAFVVCGIVPTTGHAAVIFFDDFESGAGNWDTAHAFSVQADPGNAANHVLLRNDTGPDWSINSTGIPAAFTATFDLQADLPGSANDQRNVRFSFHLSSPTAQVNGQGGYHLIYLNGFGTDDGFKLLRKNGSFGPETTLGTHYITSPDNLVHDMMVSDDGTGLISVFFDGLPIIQVNDAANYLGANGQYVGVYASTVAQMQTYVDNVRVQDYTPVPEPGSLSLLGMGLLASRARLRRKKQ